MAVSAGHPTRRAIDSSYGSRNHPDRGKPTTPNQRLTLTGAATLVFGASTFSQAAPASHLLAPEVFLSLDRLDIVLKPGPDGGPRYVQTDHRILPRRSSRSLTFPVIFAIIRVFPEPEVKIVEPGSPEPTLSSIRYRSGPRLPPHARSVRRVATFFVGDAQQPLSGPGEPVALGEIVESAFTNLARAVGP